LFLIGQTFVPLDANNPAGPSSSAFVLPSPCALPGTWQLLLFRMFCRPLEGTSRCPLCRARDHSVVTSPLCP
jgi:hypothetical protein